MAGGSDYESALLAVENSPRDDYGAVEPQSPSTPGRISSQRVITAASPTTSRTTTHNDPSLRNLLQTEHLR